MRFKTLLLAAAVLSSFYLFAPAAEARGVKVRFGPRRGISVRHVVRRPVIGVRVGIPRVGVVTYRKAPIAIGHIHRAPIVRPVIVHTAPRGYWKDVPVTQQVFVPGPIMTDPYGNPAYDQYGKVLHHPGTYQTVVVGTQRVWVNG